MLYEIVSNDGIKRSEISEFRINDGDRLGAPLNDTSTWHNDPFSNPTKRSSSIHTATIDSQDKLFIVQRNINGGTPEIIGVDVDVRGGRETSSFSNVTRANLADLNDDAVSSEHLDEIHYVYDSADHILYAYNEDFTENTAETTSFASESTDIQDADGGLTSNSERLLLYSDSDSEDIYPIERIPPYSIALDSSYEIELVLPSGRTGGNNGGAFDAGLDRYYEVARRGTSEYALIAYNEEDVVEDESFNVFIDGIILQDSTFGAGDWVDVEKVDSVFNFISATDKNGGNHYLTQYSDQGFYLRHTLLVPSNEINTEGTPRALAYYNDKLYVFLTKGDQSGGMTRYFAYDYNELTGAISNKTTGDLPSPYKRRYIFCNSDW